uniref:Putative secreted protein n=1 Tax=Ixodes ricinus TaxID=34613 RepID=A0A6B0U886_IXORI
MARIVPCREGAATILCFTLCCAAGKAISASSLLWGRSRRHKLSCSKDVRGSCQRYELALLAFAAVQRGVKRSIDASFGIFLQWL